MNRLKEYLEEFIGKENSRSKIEPAFFKCLELISSGIGELHEFLWTQKRNQDFINLVVVYGLLEITPEWMKCVQSLNEHSTKGQISDGMEQVLVQILFPSEKLPANITNEMSGDYANFARMPILQQYKTGDAFDFGTQTTERQVLALKTLEMFEFKDINRYVNFINRVKVRVWKFPDALSTQNFQ